MTLLLLYILYKLTIPAMTMCYYFHDLMTVYKSQIVKFNASEFIQRFLLPE